MSYETEAFTDIVRLSAATGRVPKEIPDHYWRFCWAMRRTAMGNKAPNVGYQDIFTRSKPIKLPYVS